MSPDLANHLDHMRRKALEATCMAEALNAVIDYPDQKHIAVSLIKTLTDLGHTLTEGLDKQNLPVGRSLPEPRRLEADEYYQIFDPARNQGLFAVLDQQTPVAALFREWKAAKIAEEAAFAASDDDAVGQQEWDARVAIEKRLMEAPATSAADWAMKIAAWCNFGESSSQDSKQNPQLWAEASALVGV